MFAESSAPTRDHRFLGKRHRDKLIQYHSKSARMVANCGPRWRRHLSLKFSESLSTEWVRPPPTTARSITLLGGTGMSPRVGLSRAVTQGPSPLRWPFGLAPSRQSRRHPSQSGRHHEHAGRDNEEAISQHANTRMNVTTIFLAGCLRDPAEERARGPHGDDTVPYTGLVHALRRCVSCFSRHSRRYANRSHRRGAKKQVLHRVLRARVRGRTARVGKATPGACSRACEWPPRQAPRGRRRDLHRLLRQRSGPPSLARAPCARGTLRPWLRSGRCHFSDFVACKRTNSHDLEMCTHTDVLKTSSHGARRTSRTDARKRLAVLSSAGRVANQELRNHPRRARRLYTPGSTGYTSRAAAAEVDQIWYNVGRCRLKHVKTGPVCAELGQCLAKFGRHRQPPLQKYPPILLGVVVER